MLSLNDIKNQKFRRAGFRGGYMEEDVNDFLDEVESSYAALIQKTAEQRDEVERQKAQVRSLQEKIDALDGQVEQYRKEEDDIKSALVSAQKMRDASIREARHQAEAIINDAKRKASEIVSGASKQIGDEQQKLDNLKQEVSDFRSSLLDLYKKHLTLINALPRVEKKAGPAPEPETSAVPQVEENAPTPAVVLDDAPESTADIPAQPVPSAEPKQPEPVSFSPMPREPAAAVARPAPEPVQFGDEYDLEDDDVADIFDRKK